MITSPNDPDNPHTVTTNFPFVERGKIPHRDVGNPGPGIPALWRGKDAKGSDEGEFKIEAKGQMPKDDVLRPSTIPGCARSYVTPESECEMNLLIHDRTWTPIHIAHTLESEVFFSIWGKTEFGEDMKRPGPGGLQVMRIKRPVVVPSVSLSHLSLMDLTNSAPSYPKFWIFRNINRPPVANAALTRTHVNSAAHDLMKSSVNVVHPPSFLICDTISIQRSQETNLVFVLYALGRALFPMENPIGRRALVDWLWTRRKRG
jgi:hypothetical protein